MLITELTELDPAIKKVLPHDSTVLAIVKHSHSLWTSSFKVETRRPDGELIDYFLKCSLGERGRLMIEGEFEGSKAIYAVSPDFCPAPIAAGKFTGLEDAYFYICEFVEMTSISPPGAESTFCDQLAALHKNGKSPNGKFGFHVTTHTGWIPQLNDWEESWTTFFRKGFVNLLDLDRKTNSPAVTGLFDEYLDKFLDVVIPRLLLPLETEGNSIEPSLIHGDLSCANTATSAGKNQPIIFGSATFYAHNEYELGNWRPKRNKFTAAHMRKYQIHFPISEPAEEFEDRHILYSIRFNLHATILFPASSLYRQFVLEDMAYLVDKYGDETLE